MDKIIFLPAHTVSKKLEDGAYGTYYVDAKAKKYI